MAAWKRHYAACDTWSVVLLERLATPSNLRRYVRYGVSPLVMVVSACVALGRRSGGYLFGSGCHIAAMLRADQLVLVDRGEPADPLKDEFHDLGDQGDPGIVQWGM